MGCRDPRSTVGTAYGLCSISCPFVVHIVPLRSIKVHKIFQNIDLERPIPGSMKSLLVLIGPYWVFLFGIGGQTYFFLWAVWVNSYSPKGVKNLLCVLC